MCECYKYHESAQDLWETCIVMAAFQQHYLMNKSTVSSFKWFGTRSGKNNGNIQKSVSVLTEH